MSNIPLNKIDTERFPNPRGSIDPAGLREFADSIEKHSQLQPIVVSGGNTADGRYYLVCGFRRYAAHQLLGRTTIPATVKRIPVAQVPVVQLIENVDREPLPLLDECAALARIRDANTLSIQDLSKLYGRSQGYITQRIAIHRLPDEVKAAYLDGKIQFSDLRDISGVKGEDRGAAQVDALHVALASTGDAQPTSVSDAVSPAKSRARTRKAVRQTTRQAAVPPKRRTAAERTAERTGEKPGAKAMEGTTEERLEALTERMRAEVAREIGATRLSAKTADAVTRVIAMLHQERLLLLP